MAKDISQEDVHHAVGEVMHPAISRTLVELGMVKDITLKHNQVTLTLALPILDIPVSIKNHLVNSLREAVKTVGTEAEVKITEMNQEERRAFLAMEQESWKGVV